MKIKTIQRGGSWKIPGFRPSGTLVPEVHLDGWQVHLLGPLIFLERHLEEGGSLLYRVPEADGCIEWELAPGETFEQLKLNRWSSPIFRKLKDPAVPTELHGVPPAVDVPPTAEELENERDDFDGEAPISLGGGKKAKR